MPGLLEMHEISLFIEEEKSKQKWREDMDRIAEAIGMSKGANYGDILGQIDEIVIDAKKYRAHE